MSVRKTASLSTLIDDAAHALAEYARWPDTLARAEAADLEVGHLRDGLHGYDPIIYSSLLIRTLTRYLTHAEIHNVKSAGLRLGLIKFADIVGTK